MSFYPAEVADVGSSSGTFHAPESADFGTVAPVFEIYWLTVGIGAATFTVAMIAVVTMVRRRSRARPEVQ